MEDFKKGRIKVLTNCGLFTEGIDIVKLDAVQLLRPTKSLALYLQMVGRCLRVSKDKKKAIILDHANNFENHGLPSDKREWTLDTKKKDNDEGGTVGTKTCPECFLVLSSMAKVCPSCGHKFVVVKPRIVEEVDGELVELDRKKEIMKRKQEVHACKSFEELVELGKSRGYSRPKGWAKHVMAAREAKKKKSQ